jgi:hypothetical protein
MRNERVLLKEAGVILSQVAKRFDHVKSPGVDELLSACRKEVAYHVKQRVQQALDKGLGEPEPDKLTAIKDALFEVVLISMRHRLVFSRNYTALKEAGWS